jgi:hypothetical protein
MEGTAPDSPEPAVTGLWCTECSEPVRRSGRVAVHVDTGFRECAKGASVANLTAVDPALVAVAKVLTDESKGRWRVWAGLGGLFAERSDIAGPHAMVDAADEAEMRAKLAARDGIIEWAAVDAARRAAVQP